MPKFLDSYNYAVLMNEAYTNDGLKGPYDETALQKFKDGSDPDFYPNSDWLGTLLSEKRPVQQPSLEYQRRWRQSNLLAGIQLS